MGRSYMSAIALAAADAVCVGISAVGSGDGAGWAAMDGARPMGPEVDLHARGNWMEPFRPDGAADGVVLMTRGHGAP